jgi:hypothetical protein
MTDVTRFLDALEAKETPEVFQRLCAIAKAGEMKWGITPGDWGAPDLSGG